MEILTTILLIVIGWGGAVIGINLLIGLLSLESVSEDNEENPYL